MTTAACDEDDEPLPTRKRGANAGLQASRPAPLCALQPNPPSTGPEQKSLAPQKKKSRLSRIPKGNKAPGANTSCLSVNASATVACRQQTDGTASFVVSHQSHPAAGHGNKAFVCHTAPQGLNTKHGYPGSVQCRPIAASGENREQPIRASCPTSDRAQLQQTCQMTNRGEIFQSASYGSHATRLRAPSAMQAAVPKPANLLHEALPAAPSSFRDSGGQGFLVGNAVHNRQSTQSARVQQPAHAGSGCTEYAAVQSHGPAHVSERCISTDDCTVTCAYVPLEHKISAPGNRSIFSTVMPSSSDIKATAVQLTQHAVPSHQLPCASSRGPVQGHQVPLREAVQQHQAIFVRNHTAEAQLASALCAKGAIDLAGKLQEEGMTAALVMLADDASLRQLILGNAQSTVAGATVPHAQLRTALSSIPLDVSAAVQLVRAVASGMWSDGDGSVQPTGSKDTSSSGSEVLLLRALKARDRYYSRMIGSTSGTVQLQSSAAATEHPVVEPTRGKCVNSVPETRPALPCTDVKKCVARVVGQYCRSAELRIWRLCHGRIQQPHGSKTVDRCSSDQNHERFDKQSTVAVAQGRGDLELGVHLCAAIVSGTTKYGCRIRPVQNDCQVGALDAAAVYDVDASGQLVIVSR